MDDRVSPGSGPAFQTARALQIFLARFWGWAIRLMPLFGKDPTKFEGGGDVNLRELTEVDFPVHVRVDTRAVAEIKRRPGRSAPLRAEARRAAPRFIAKLMGDREEFMRAIRRSEQIPRKADVRRYLAPVPRDSGRG
jgi:hypothetical protein